MKMLRALRQDPTLLDRARERAKSGTPTIDDWCLFIGHPRSGHSLFGALIDAQPDAVIAHELDLLGFFGLGAREPGLLAALCIERAEWFRRQGCVWGSHDYSVPDGWQGRVRSHTLVGDKKGGRTTRRLIHNPHLLDDLSDTLGGHPWIIHVARHPLDNIATMVQKRGYSLDEGIEDFFKLAAGVEATRRRHPPERWIDIEQSTLCYETHSVLTSVLEKVMPSFDSDIALRATAIVDDNPRRSRTGISWTTKQISRVRSRCEVFDPYAAYVADDDWDIR